MAENIKVGIEVSDNGTAGKTTKNVQNLKDVIDSTAASAGKASKAIQSAYSGGGRTAAASKAGGTTGMSTSELVEYNVGRSAGGTGAASRDFAKQAEGLGGLVRLYATFAANVFAATAALSALSNAADTTNMVKGMDQLGAASGQALGTLSKRLVEATDGAISLKEAMEATTKGATAGLSSKQMIDMATGAKQAAAALGLSVPDAISRLSRGIAKLEPELLDELGIFTKIGPATEDYARFVGKSTLALTDFEKRQAFANAVLKELKDKYSNIQIDSNPYTKLSATFKNVTQTGLELANTVLTPITKLLAESPTALAGVLAYISITLLKQAIPALTSWRQQLNSAAEAAAATAKRLRDSYEEFDIGKKMRAGLQEARVAAEAANQALAGTQASLSQVLSPKSKILARTMSEGYGAETAIANQKAIEAQLTKEQNALIKLKALRDTINVSEVEHLKIMDADIAKQEIRLGQMKQAALLNKVYIEEETKKAAALTGAEAAGAASTIEGRAKDIVARRAEMAASRAKILSNVGENTQIMGAKEAWKRLLDEVKNGPGIFNEFNERVSTTGKGLTGISKITTIASGGIRILGSSLMLGLSALQGYLIILPLLIAGFELLSSLWSTNSKEVDNFNKSLENAHTAGELVSSTLDNLLKKDFEKVISVQTVLAKASAFNELTQSVTDLTTSFDLANVKASGFDKFIDGFKIPFGKDLKSTYTKELSFAISKGIDALPEGALRKETEEKLKNILGTKSLTFEGLKDAINDIPKEKIVNIGQAVVEVIDQANKANKKLTEPLRQLETSFEAASKAFDEFSNSLKSSDALTKYGFDITKVGIDLVKAFQDPQSVLIELNNIIKDTNKLKLFSLEDQRLLIASQKSIEAITGRIAAYDLQIIQARKDLEKLPERDSLFDRQGKKSREEVEKRLQTATGGRASLEKELETLTVSLSKIAPSELGKGIDLVFKEITKAASEAQLTISRAVISGMSGIGTAGAQAELKRQEIDLQLKSISTIEQQIIEQKEGNLLLMQSNALARQRYLQERGAKMTDVELQENIQLQKDIPNLQKALDIVISSRAGGKGFSFENFKALPNEVKSFLLPLIESLQGSEVKKIALRGQRVGVGIEERRATTQEQQQISQRLLQNTINLKNVEVERVKLLTTGSEIISEDLLRIKQSQEQQLETLTNKKAQEEIENKIVIARKAYSDAELRLKGFTFAQYQDLLKQKGELVEQQNARIKINEIIRQQEQISRRASQAQRELEFLNEQRAIRFEITTSINDQKKKEIDYLESIGAVSAQTAQDRRKNLDFEYQRQQETKDYLDLEAEKQSKLNNLKAEYDKKFLAADDMEKQLALLFEEVDAQTKLNTVYDLKKQKLDQITEARKQELKLLYDLNEREKGYAEAFKGAFKGMEDAIVEFTKTGKLSFTNMINTFLEDLLRLEIRMAYTKQLESIGGFGGLAKMFGSFLGFGSKGTTATQGGDAGVGYGSLFGGPYANGGAFDQGVRKYAMGGAFTNSIVDSPTLFKFAKGTGMMGEAGPEAIMPLKRDTQGRLGVSSTQGTTQVVVNNYTTIPATTRESTDSRGNRRVEVVIGDMTAGEISRTGSNSQRAIQGTFGLQPQLVRR